MAVVMFAVLNIWMHRGCAGYGGKAGEIIRIEVERGCRGIRGRDRGTHLSISSQRLSSSLIHFFSLVLFASRLSLTPSIF